MHRTPTARTANPPLHRAAGAARPVDATGPVRASRTRRGLLLAGIAAAAVATGLHPGMARADDWPAKPVRIIVPWAAGGAADFLARLIAPRMSQQLGVPVLIENRAGAATNLGTQAVADAPADGYTLLMASTNNAVNETLFPKLPFDFRKDFRPITNVGLAPLVLVTAKAVPAKNVTELIALARREPGKLTYGSSGAGSSAHLAGEMFARRAGIELIGVPYKGAAPAITDLAGGQLTMMITVIPPLIGHVKSGRLNLLAVASPEPLPQFPDTPTIAATGLPGFEASIWYGLVARSAVPDAVVSRLQALVAGILKDPQVREQMLAQGTFAIGDSPQAFQQTIDRDVQVLGDLVRQARIAPE